MEMYVDYFDMEEKRDDENPAIGLILCSENDKSIVQYILSQKSQVFSKEYCLVLLNEKEIRKLIEDTKEKVSQN